ncbi:MAG: histone deacetylase family protein [Desulfobulbaceae bacterium]|nr:MAG: histone deacetylase family protein [Desulfobulbaceae bacterium]
MKVYFHTDFYEEYTSDPAAESGRMEAIVEAITPVVDLVSCSIADEDELRAAHPQAHIEQIRRIGLYEIAALAAGGAIQAAHTGMNEPSFGLIRPPGHHASANSCWGFCYLNNLAVSLYSLKNEGLIDSAFVLDFDLHYGDGNVNILGHETWVELLNPETNDRQKYLDEVQAALAEATADIIAVSAGFDNHINDWGGLLYTEDYRQMARWVRAAAERNEGGCYGILEGGYNHNVLGNNVLAFIEGLDDPVT